MQATWGQWGAQAATTGVASSMAGFSMPPPTTAASTASTAATGAAATQSLGAFSMGSYPMYNAQAAALNPAVSIFLINSSKYEVKDQENLENVIGLITEKIFATSS